MAKRSTFFNRPLASMAALFLTMTASAGAYPVRDHSYYRPSPESVGATSYRSVFAPYGSSSAAGKAQTLQQHEDYLTEISGDGFYSWPRQKLPVKVFVADGSGVAGYRPQFKTIIESCFDEWARVSGGRLAWVRADDRAEADIVVHWTANAVERSNGTEAGRTRTYTQFDTETNYGVIERADMSLVTALPDRELTDGEVRRAYLHEVGHAFGLAGHSPYKNDIMYASISPTQRAVLSQRDISSINNLYDTYSPMHVSDASPGMPKQSRQAGLN